jgi:RHS repeat-associated protein
VERASAPPGPGTSLRTLDQSLGPQPPDASADWADSFGSPPLPDPEEGVPTLQAGGISLPPLLITIGSPKRFTWTFFSWDHLGSIRLITDGTGSQIAHTKYLPYGEETPDPSRALSGNTRRFTGHERDLEDGLDYMLARYYGSSLGRFHSPDPGKDTDLEDPQSWNMYTYVRSNPVLLTDPDGRKVKFEGTRKQRREAKRKFKEAAKSDKRLKQAWKNLKKSKNVHTIKPWDKDHQFNQNIADDRTKASNGTGTGSTTYFNPNAETNADGQAVPQQASAAHEISHMEDADTGTRNPTPDPASGVKTNEIKAVRVENINRRATGFPQRTTYGGQAVPNPFDEPPNPWP